MADVFVTLGTHPQQFNRLLREIDALIGAKKINGAVFCQKGFSDYEPKNFKSKKFLSLDEFSAEMKKAGIIITHAGEGNIGTAKNMGKKMIVVPRRKEFAEHTNDHQLELAKVVEEKNIGLVAWQAAELGEKVSRISAFAPSKIRRGNIAGLLEGFVKGNFK